jgi:UDP:flavonoid glycosyltransferase YjiC (YdhE family)
MKLVVVTYGTEGDARPLAALCRALMDAGHEALLLADGATLGTAQSLGVRTMALAGDIRGTLQPSGSIARVVAKGSDFGGTAKVLAQIANAHAEAWMRSVVTAGHGCDAIVVSGLAAFVGLSAAEYLGITAIGAGLIPITPTSAFASPFLPPRFVPRFFNRPSHSLVNALLWRAFRDATNDARAKVCGLAPRREGWTRHPMLYGVSPTLVPRPRDWPANARMCGQWTPPDPGFAPPQALAEFLAAGDAPLYIGFGSMAGFDRQQLIGELVAAVAGRRALFNPGWSGADVSGLPANFFAVGDIPHAWLFPQTSLVVHHGGSGTSHSATRAGVPSVVVPFAGDQFFWADRLCRIGVAAGPVRGKDLRAQDLARNIDLAGRDGMRSRAREAGQKMMAEEGLTVAISAIEEIMAG